jgi:enoyl-CoA hydratase/3-hydroxypropionyl-coenzyme A dehydratase
MKKYETIDCMVEEGVATLTFNRPDQLNAMSRHMMDEIIDALHAMRQNDAIAVAVITGRGRAFMAGADIKEYARQTPEAFRSFQEKGRQLYALIEGAEIPFIAGVNGYALGGGFEIALACDFIVAAASAKMGLPEVHLGLIPGGGGAQRLMQKVGISRVKEMLLLGQSYTAADLQAWGLVHAVAEDEALGSVVAALADRLKRRPRQAMKAIKAMLEPSAAGAPFESRLDREGQIVADLFRSPVAGELIKNFADKTK